MLHTKFHGIWSISSREDFNQLGAWWPSWSCDPDAANKLRFPLTIAAPHKISFDWPSGFGEDV